jgi:hypothetical protein
MRLRRSVCLGRPEHPLDDAQSTLDNTPAVVITSPSRSMSGFLGFLSAGRRVAGRTVGAWRSGSSS